MKRKIFISLLVIFLVTGLVSQAFSMAKRPAAKKKTSAKPTAVVSKIDGKVTGYSWQVSTITISTSSGTSLTIDIDKNTRISKAGKTIKMTDIKSGDAVTVDYESKGSKKIAKSIIVRTKTVPAAVKEKKKR